MDGPGHFYDYCQEAFRRAFVLFSDRSGERIELMQHGGKDIASAFIVSIPIGRDCKPYAAMICGGGRQIAADRAAAAAWLRKAADQLEFPDPDDR